MAAKSKAQHIAEARNNRGRDLSPRWDGHESWNTDQFLRHFRESMDWYRLESSVKDLKPKVINWMAQNEFDRNQIQQFKDTKDWRCSLTMGAMAANLLKGMPAVREDFNSGKNTADWLRGEIVRVINEGRSDIVVEEEEVTAVQPQISIQERLREAAVRMTAEIEDAIEQFQENPSDFDPKAFKLLNLLKGKEAKAAHARIIRDFYITHYEELLEAQEGTCEQLNEAYNYLSKAELKKITGFYHDIVAACDMLMQEAKVNRKPKARKTQPKDKIVAKLKYAKSCDTYKLVSINPTDIIGAKELWVFNIKTRKLGKYVADEFADLSIKGTSITGFSEIKSVQKTLRKPEEQLKEFKAAGKVQLRKFLEDIKAVDIKLNGRINEDTVLLKIQ